MTIKVGDFVTCYNAGYWQLIGIKPKIATEDYSSPTISYKKGDVLGQWAILKKAFTPKMKPRIDFDYNDAAWVKPVTDEVRKQIHSYFAQNPEYKEKFDNAPVKLPESVTNVWIDISDEDAEKLKDVLKTLPQNFTIDEFTKTAKDFVRYATKPPTSYLLNILAYPWNLNENADLIYHGWELTKR